MIDADLMALATRVVEENRAAGRCICTVESCTGGLVAYAITSVPGASDVFERGFIVYSDSSKVEAVGVGEDIVATFGAVSEATAWALAEGGITHSNADVCVSVTGIAGPSGGSDRKPVGMVIFGRATRAEHEPYADTRNFGDLGREEIRRQAALMALELLLP